MKIYILAAMIAASTATIGAERAAAHDENVTAKHEEDQAEKAAEIQNQDSLNAWKAVEARNAARLAAKQALEASERAALEAREKADGDPTASS